MGLSFETYKDKDTFFLKIIDMRKFKRTTKTPIPKIFAFLL